MAKFDITIDIDWLETDGTIDERIKEEIIASIENRIYIKLNESVRKKVDGSLDTLCEDIATKMITEKTQELLSKPRNVTNKFGEVTREGVTLEDYLTEALESAFEKKTLDDEGRPTQRGYSAEYSIFEYFSQKKFIKIVSDRIEELSKETEKNIENLVSEKIKTQVADKLTNLIVNNSSTLSLNTDSKEKST